MNIEMSRKSSSAAATRGGRFHRGWTVLAAAGVGVFMTVPGQTVGVAPFVDLIARDLGLAREQVVLLYSLGTLVGILPAPLVGRLLDRYGPRRLIVFAAVALAASCAAMAVAMNPWSLALAFTVLRGSAIGGLSVTSVNMVNLWFERLRGRATAVAMLGLAAGGMVIPRVAEQITIGHGWRAAYLALGAAVLVIMLPVGLIFFRNRPQDYGMLPDFGRQQSAEQVDRRDFTLGEAVRTPAFWYLVSLSVLYNAVGTALMLDHMRLIQSVGVDRGTAIHLLGFVPLAQVVATLCGGYLVDKLGARHAGFCGIAAVALTLICVMNAPYVFGGFIYALSLGTGIGILSVAAAAGLAEYFGTRHMGTLRGMTFLFGIFGAAAGPLPLALSPQLAHWIFLICAGLAVGLGVATRSRAVAR
jgi:MFS family permease